MIGPYSAPVTGRVLRINRSVSAGFPGFPLGETPPLICAHENRGELDYLEEDGFLVDNDEPHGAERQDGRQHGGEPHLPLVDAILRGAFIFPIGHLGIEGGFSVVGIGLDLGFSNIELPSPDPQLAFLYIENAIDGFGGKARLRGLVRFSHAHPRARARSVAGPDGDK